jgi:hypothetical protein
MSKLRVSRWGAQVLEGSRHERLDELVKVAMVLVFRGPIQVKAGTPLTCQKATSER